MSHQSFYQLEPNKVLLAAETAGFAPTGSLTQLNSYENRVFDIKLENGSSVIAKFYRPGRWTKESILEEHRFLRQLSENDIPAVPALVGPDGSTLRLTDNMHTAFFPKVLGRMPQEFIGDDLKKVGRLMAMVHNSGASEKALHRPIMDSSFHGAWSALDLLVDWIAPEVQERYINAAETILENFSDLINPNEFIRIHGDCHRGNLLHNGEKFFLVDFDDFCMGPVIQDFWMLLSGDQALSGNEQAQIISGYEELREFPDHQWEWVPWLRGMRIISYAAWIARRWQDPSFPRLFPNFQNYTYWAEEVEALEKIAWSSSRASGH